MIDYRATGLLNQECTCIVVQEATVPASVVAEQWAKRVAVACIIKP